jgi:integrase
MKQKEKKVRGVYEKVVGSNNWWIRYNDATGKLRRETAGTKSAAITLYRKRKTEALENRKLPENLRSVVKVEDLAPALLRDYEVNKKKSAKTVKYRLNKHVLPFFGSLSIELTTDQFNRYIDKRRRAGAENATINRELAALKRIFNLARYSQPPLVRDLPVFPPRLKENPPRQGFAEAAQYAALQRHAHQPWLKAILATDYTFGFRRSELLLKLKVAQVDLKRRTIRLLAGETKNDEGRTVFMTNEVYELLRGCVTGKKASDFVFTREDGTPVRDFRGAWWRLCEDAGLGSFVRYRDSKGKQQQRWEGLLFHDLRRSAVRNMVRDGVHESTAMKISGHKTPAIFQRYNIVSESDLADAARKMEHGRTVYPTDTTTDTGSTGDFESHAAAAD